MPIIKSTRYNNNSLADLDYNMCTGRHTTDKLIIKNIKGKKMYINLEVCFQASKHFVVNTPPTKSSKIFFLYRIEIKGGKKFNMV